MYETNGKVVLTMAMIKHECRFKNLIIIVLIIAMVSMGASMHGQSIENQKHVEEITLENQKHIEEITSEFTDFLSQYDFTEETTTSQSSANGGKNQLITGENSNIYDGVENPVESVE